jgi:hypothetical protein
MVLRAELRTSVFRLVFFVLCRDKKNRNVSNMVLTFVDFSNLFPMITS